MEKPVNLVKTEESSVVEATGSQATASRHQEILETAAQLICSDGYERTSMSAIAEACGLTKAGLYHHIHSKEHLLSEIMHYGMDIFEEQVLSKVSGIADPVERLEATLDKHVQLVTGGRNKEVTVILHEHDTLTGDARKRINARKKNYVRFLESSFAEAIARGRIRHVQPKVAAYSFLGMVNWIYKWHRADGEFSPRFIGEEMRRILFGGLGPEMSPPSVGGAEEKQG
jgi:AcrR family transcriptional regulator